MTTNVMVAPDRGHARSTPAGARTRSGPRLDLSGRRALVAYAVALAVWQLGATSPRWLGHAVPFLSRVPAPSAVVAVWRHLLVDPGYWSSWYESSRRVVIGFAAAVLTGAPLGVLLARTRSARAVVFPVFELLRPVPPLAWVPAAIIFWPTQELSIDFVIFLGAFYTVVLSTMGGADGIDERFIQVARSMGASRWNVLHQLVLPSILPSLLVGMEVSIGITWEVVVAAEMISGGGSGGGSSSGGGLGFFIWNSYVGGSYPQIVVGMISIGIAGYASSLGLRVASSRLTRWSRHR